MSLPLTVVAGTSWVVSPALGDFAVDQAVQVEDGVASRARFEDQVAVDGDEPARSDDPLDRSTPAPPR